MKHIYRLVIFTLLIAFSACGEEEIKNIFGSPVDFKINLNAWDNDLRVPLAVKTYTVPRAEGRYIGFGGLLVLTSPLNPIAPNIYPLYAFDLACPYEQESNVKLSINNRTEATCLQCKSTFNIIDGWGRKLSGPSPTGLQRYRALNDTHNPEVFWIVN